MSEIDRAEGTPVEQRAGTGSEDSAFLRVLAHELRNYIAPMNNAMHLLRLKSRADATLGPVIDIVERQITAMVAALDAVSEADRVRRNELVLERGTIRVGDLIEHAITAASRGQAAQRRRVTSETPDPDDTLHVDPQRMTRAVAALIDNALRYSGAASIVRVSARSTEGRFEMEVEDSGAGMSAEARQRAVLLHGLPHQAGHGLGLGLPLAFAVIRAHGGALELAPASSGGTRAIVRLPHASGGSAISPAVVTAPAPDAAPNRGRRVLLADDSPAVRTSLADLLQELGHEVRCAADGAEAVALAESWRPEFVLLDIHMPKLNGFEAARAIRDRFSRDDMQLVMMSGDDLDDVVRQGARKAGFDHCIDKGLAIGELARILAGVQGEV